ncbi:MAG: hypothetical protein HQL91_07010 [Magnetococcales bacterium]|nr:hypothetical protein [Magnetococcales bacterium]
MVLQLGLSALLDSLEPEQMTLFKVFFEFTVVIPIYLVLSATLGTLHRHLPVPARPKTESATDLPSAS